MHVMLDVQDTAADRTPVGDCSCIIIRKRLALASRLKVLDPDLGSRFQIDDPILTMMLTFGVLVGL